MGVAFVAVPEKIFVRIPPSIFSTAATPFCSLFPPLAALANVLSSKLFDSLSSRDENPTALCKELKRSAENAGTVEHDQQTKGILAKVKHGFFTAAAFSL